MRAALLRRRESQQDSSLALFRSCLCQVSCPLAAFVKGFSRCPTIMDLGLDGVVSTTPCCSLLCALTCLCTWLWFMLGGHPLPLRRLCSQTLWDHVLLCHWLTVFNLSLGLNFLLFHRGNTSTSLRGLWGGLSKLIHTYKVPRRVLVYSKHSINVSYYYFHHLSPNYAGFVPIQAAFLPLTTVFLFAPQCCVLWMTL